MEELRRVLKSFSELRDNYTDIGTAIEAVSCATKVDLGRVLEIICKTGVYISPDSDEDREIKKYLSSVDVTKTVDELAKEVGFLFCISTREAKRLVRKWDEGGIV